MTKIQSYVLPAAILSCMLVVWFTTLAARALPANWQPAQLAAAQAALTQSGAGNSTAQSASMKNGACQLSQRYPASILQWCDLITQVANANQLPIELIAAVMLQESGGNPLAYSGSGAVGLLQVMPKDGIAASFQCPNGPCFQSRPSTTELQDPEFNLSFGTRMLAGLINKYGSIREALVHYGPANVGYYYADKVLAIFDNYR